MKHQEPHPMLKVSNIFLTNNGLRKSDQNFVDLYDNIQLYMSVLD